MDTRARVHYQSGRSNVPYLGTELDPFDDAHVRVLYKLLDRYAPELLVRFRYVVIESTKQLEGKVKALSALEDRKLELIQEIEKHENSLDYKLGQVPSQPGTSIKSNATKVLLTVGLSVFLFIGVLFVFDIRVSELSRLRNVPAICLSLIAASAINVAERETIERHVKYNFDVRRRRQERRIQSSELEVKKNVGRED